MITKGSLTQIQQLRAAVKAAATIKRAETDTARYIAGLATVERDVVGCSIKLSCGRVKTPTANFAVPVKRNKEYRSSTGQRTFHMGWSSVTKSRVLQSKPGTRVYAGAASRHVVYIEDGVVVRQGHTVYIDSSRVEMRPDGERLVESNISDDCKERVEFFQFVEQFERVNHGDKVDIDFSINTLEWTRAVTDPHCDVAVVEAYEEYLRGRNSSNEKIALIGSSSDLQEVMARYGFKINKRTVNKLQLQRDGVCFRNGRGGRTEYRLVFELPREFNSVQRAEALKRICQRFKDAGCMYVAVIHAPDPHNSQENHHIHLDFYDRKCRRLDGTDVDLDNVKPQFLSDILEERERGDFSEAVRKGAWDFTVVRTYNLKKAKKTHRPFYDEHKSKPLRDKGFVKTVREGFAEDVNAIARLAQMDEVYDPREYAAMGINAPVTEKLGPKRHALETKGIPTKIGMKNETAQAEFETRMIEQAYDDQCRHINEIQFHWQIVSEQAPAELNAAKLKVDAELANAREAAEIRRDLDHLSLEQERERSRARLVSERQGRASKTGSPAAQLRSTELAQSADDYIAILDQRDSGLVASIGELEVFTGAHGAEQAERAVLQFDLELRKFEYDRKNQNASNKNLAPTQRTIVTEQGNSGPIDINPQNTVAPTSSESSALPRRNIMTKRGTFGLFDNNPKTTGELAADQTSIPPRKNIMTKRGTLARIDGNPKDALVTPEALPVTAAVPHLRGRSAVDPNQQPHAVSTSLLQTDARSRATSDASNSPINILPGLENLGTADRIDATAATHEVQEPSMPSRTTLVDVDKGTGLSLLVENSAAPSDLSNQQSFSPTQKPNGPTVIHDTIKQSVGRVDQMSGRRDVASSAANSTTQHFKDGTRTSSGVVNYPDAGNNGDRPIIASDPKNTDMKTLPAITQASANQTHHMQPPTQISSAEDDLDPVTAYKVLWMYRDIDFKAQKSPMNPENRLYDKAMAHPQSNELLSALARRIGNKGDAAKVAIVPSAKLDKPLTQVPQSLSGTDNIVEQSSAEPESRVALARTVPSSVKSLDDPDKSVAAQPSIKDGAIKDNSKFDSAQARVAIPPPRADEHESLIHRFLTARDDKERRIAAGLIRADKTALERMAQRNDPRWIAFDRQFRIQQHTAGRDRGGIGW